MNDKAMDVDAELAAPEPLDDRTPNVVGEKFDKYSGPTAFAAAACAALIWLGNYTIIPVFESQREINKANAEASRTNAEAVREFSKSIQDLKVAIEEKRTLLQDMQKTIASQSQAESNNHEAMIRILQGIVSVQEDISRRLRESPPPKGAQ